MFFLLRVSYQLILHQKKAVRSPPGHAELEGAERFSPERGFQQIRLFLGKTAHLETVCQVRAQEHPAHGSVPERLLLHRLGTWGAVSCLRSRSCPAGGVHICGLNWAASWTCSWSCVCNLRFSNRHFINSESEISFDNMLCLMQCIQNSIFSTSNQHLNYYRGL